MGQTPDSSTRRLADLVKRFDNAILVTRCDAAPAGVHGRPMAIAKVDGDADLWFITSVDAPKAKELVARPEVLVTLQGPSSYIVLQGTAHLTQDRGKIDELWHATYDAWFPEGKKDPSIAVVCMHVEAGEFWDMKASHRLRYLWEAAKAYFKREPPRQLEGMHGVVGQAQVR